MISNLFKSLRLTIAFCLFFSVFYIFVLWLFAQVAGPNKGNAELVTLNGKVVGAANVVRILHKIFISGAVLPMLVTVTMHPVRQVVTRDLPMKNIWPCWKNVLIHFWSIILT